MDSHAPLCRGIATYFGSKVLRATYAMRKKPPNINSARGRLDNSLPAFRPIFSIRGKHVDYFIFWVNKRG